MGTVKSLPAVPVIRTSVTDGAEPLTTGLVPAIPPEGLFMPERPVSPKDVCVPAIPEVAFPSADLCPPTVGRVAGFTPVADAPIPTSLLVSREGGISEEACGFPLSPPPTPGGCGILGVRSCWSDGWSRTVSWVLLYEVCSSRLSTAIPAAAKDIRVPVLDTVPSGEGVPPVPRAAIVIEGLGVLSRSPE